MDVVGGKTYDLRPRQICKYHRWQTEDFKKIHFVLCLFKIRKVYFYLIACQMTDLCIKLISFYFQRSLSRRADHWLPSNNPLKWSLRHRSSDRRYNPLFERDHRITSVICQRCCHLLKNGLETDLMQQSLMLKGLEGERKHSLLLILCCSTMLTISAL